MGRSDPQYEHGEERAKYQQSTLLHVMALQAERR